MTYEEFQQALTTGRIRLVGDENGNSSYFMYDENGATPLPGFVPPQKPVAPTFDNLGAGLQTALTSGGTPVYATTNLGADGNWQNAQQNYYLQGDPNMPADAAPAMAGGYSSDNGGGGFKDMFSEGLPFLALAAGGALAAPAVGATALGGAGAGATLGAGSAGGLAAAGGGNLADVLRAGATGGTVGAVTGGIGDYLSSPTVANSGMDFGGQGVGWSPDQITGATEAISPVAQTAPVSQPTTLQELLAQAQAPVPTLADAGITQTYTPSDPFLVNPNTAETPWLSNAPEGSVMAAETATPTINAIAPPGGGGLSAIINAPTGAMDTVAPTATGGGEGTATKVAAAGAGGIGATKISDVLSGKVGVTDLAKNLTLGDVGNIAGTGIATVGSVLAQQDIAARNEALAREYMGFGAPSRQRYEASFAPGFDITSDPTFKNALDRTNESLLRKASITGNPAGNPGVLAEIMKYTTDNVALPYLQNYRNQNAATGGFNAFSTAAPGAATNAINATGSMYGDIAGGLADILNPRRQQKQVNLNLASLV